MGPILPLISLEMDQWRIQFQSSSHLMKIQPINFDLMIQINRIEGDPTKF